MVVLSILGTLCVAATLGAYQHSEQTRVHQGLSDLFSLVASARQQAIMSGEIIEVRPLPRGWEIAGGSRIYTRFAQWRGFRSPPIRFYPNGQSDNGTWTLCAPPFERPRALILSRTGRARTSLDRDQDGRDEAASGQPLTC